MSEAEKPVACPWCAGEIGLRVVSKSWDAEMTGQWSTVCRGCAATGPLSDTKPAAIAAWNRVARREA
jgi:hypothetical protein